MTDLSPQQNKLLMLGGMFENIIHQFKQPLNAIKTEATGLKLQKELDLLSDEEFESSLDGIIDSTHYLSNTIDDFRNFLQEDKKKENFYIKDSIEIIKSILNPLLKAQGIQIIIDIDNENISINGYPREFIQVLINIINNAKDAISIANPQIKIIFIEVKSTNTHVEIKIYDNGGGIQEEILQNIFNSHFTTKKNIGGTGIGLFMSKTIIHEHFCGNLSAINSSFKYKNNQYYGASFIINIPQSI